MATNTENLPAKPWIAIGRVPADFVEGWAKHPFVGERVHYFRRARAGQDDVRAVITACGQQSMETAQVGLLNRGSWPTCQHCARVRRRAA